MDQTIFPQYFEEPQAYQADPNNRIKFIWVNNCTGHILTLTLTAVLAKKKPFSNTYPRVQPIFVNWRTLL